MSKIIVTKNNAGLVNEHYSQKTFTEKSGLDLKSIREYADKEKISVLGTEISISDYLMSKGIAATSFAIVELL